VRNDGNVGATAGGGRRKTGRQARGCSRERRNTGGGENEPNGKERERERERESDRGREGEREMQG